MPNKIRLHPSHTTRNDKNMNPIYLYEHIYSCKSLFVPGVDLTFIIDHMSDTISLRAVHTEIPLRMLIEYCKTRNVGGYYIWRF